MVGAAAAFGIALIAALVLTPTGEVRLHHPPQRRFGLVTSPRSIAMLAASVLQLAFSLDIIS